MSVLVLMGAGGTVPPAFIRCDECGRDHVARIGGTRNGVHRHHRPDTRTWCYGPERTAKHAAAQQART